MAYKKFDDPDTKVNQSQMKVYDAVAHEALRRAIQGISNRVLGGTCGTGGGSLITATCTLGSTAGFITEETLRVVRNGIITTCDIPDATGMYFSSQGTMGSNTVAKFLICSTAGTGAQIVGPGNIIDKGDYASATLGAAAAKIPDLIDGECALGYVTLQAPAATVLVLTNSATTAAAGLGYILGTGGTAGTATYVDVVCMPYNA